MPGGVAVLGVGLIGGSIGMAVKARMPGVSVYGYDPDPAACRLAVKRGAIDRACESVAEAVAHAGACFVAAPIDKLGAVIDEALSGAGAECVVTDVGSTKRSVFEAVASADTSRYVGGHPLAGAETAGVEHARADLFVGAVWYLTPSEKTRGEFYERIHRTVAKLGARPLAIDADTHDRLMGTVSHLPHVLANTLVSQAAHTLAVETEGVPAAGPSFRDATRVAGSNPDLWTEIFMANREVVAEGIQEHVRRLQGVADELRRGDREGISRWVEAARGDRRRLVEEQIDGGSVHELRVIVANKPGSVAEVAVVLGRAGINIVDIVLHPAAGSSTGAATLWISGDKDASRAAELVAALGHETMLASGDGG